VTIAPLRPSDPPRVGPHRLLGRLGEGGMGTVFLGVSSDERAVAVKVLRNGLGDPGARQRFRHELDALRRVRGPHLVELLDADVDADTPYLVTRFVPGTRLDELVAEHGPLPADELAAVARGMADALTTLHSAGIVHRDLTPGNVLMLDGQPHVIDLGLALPADVTALTRSGLVLGTPGYLAPEQVTGAPATTAVDVHAWGATVALAGTGRPPYGTGRPEAVLYRIVHDQPDLDGLPSPVARLVAAAMQRDPTRRPSADDLVAALGGWSTAEPVTVRLPRDLDITAGTDVLDLERMQTQVISRLPPTALAPHPVTQQLELVGGGPPPPRAPLSAQEAERDDPWPFDDEAPAQPAAAPRRHPARSLQLVATSAAALGVVAAAVLVAPVVTAVLALLVLICLRAVSRSAERLRLRRDRRGQRRRDPVLAVLGAPWHLASAALDTLISLPLLAAAAAGPAALVWFADPASNGLERPELTAATATCVALAVGLSRRAHAGSRRLLRQGLFAVTPGPGAALAVLLAVAVVGVVLLGVAEGSAPSWWPWEQLGVSSREQVAAALP
jgi:hypothetical protein